MLTVTWVTEELHGPDVRFPRVDLPLDTAWIAHHSCSPRTTWLDGHFVAADMDVVLDIIAIEGADEAFEHDEFDLPEMRARARAAWDAGQVLYLDCGALVVPVSDLTEGNTIADAIARFIP